MRNLKYTRALGVALAAALSVSFLTATAASKPPKVVVSEKAIDRNASLPASFSPVVKRVAPSVVTISSTRTVNMQNFVHPFFDDPLYERFFGPRGESEGKSPRTRRNESMGSGVIVSEDGYVLTNNHVVEGADEVKVTLSDGREIKASVVGTDPQTDIALIKIEAKNLTPVTFADSDKLEVGDVVLAVGNPFRLSQTVTRGIVSAVGRGGLGIVDYEDFIQTDAAINRGNSGGPLVDIEGRLVGINQSIVSSSGGNEGVGFAVPANLARFILDQLATEGSVKRGFLGVSIQQVTPELAKAFDLEEQRGALIGGVQPGTPAADAGIKAGDVIVEFNGKQVTDPRHLRLVVAQTAPGSEAKFRVIRNGRERTLSAKLAELPGEMASASSRGTIPREAQSPNALEGVTVRDIDRTARQQFNIPSDVEGALVQRVQPGSPAQEAGLRAGDVIVEINKKAVNDADGAARLLKQSTNGQTLLRVWSRAGGLASTRYVVVETPKT